MRYLLDTNPIIIALNRGYLLPDNVYIISIITEMELLSYSKLSDKEKSEINALLSNFQIIELGSEIKNLAIELRQKYNLKLPDSIIVATAIETKSILITSDKQLSKITEVETIEINTLVDR